MFQSPASVNTQSTFKFSLETTMNKFQSPASVNTQSTADIVFGSDCENVSITCIGEHPVNKRSFLISLLLVSITCIGEHPVNNEALVTTRKTLGFNHLHR